MKKIEDKITDTKNVLYYNQLMYKNGANKKKIVDDLKIKSSSFGSQNIDLKNHIYIPEGFEYLAYVLYVIVIPYIVGSIFLFLAIANANWGNYQLIDTSAFFIVWAIGYEITAIVLVLYITRLFFIYDDY